MAGDRFLTERQTCTALPDEQIQAFPFAVCKLSLSRTTFISAKEKKSNVKRKSNLLSNLLSPSCSSCLAWVKQRLNRIGNQCTQTSGSTWISDYLRPVLAQSRPYVWSLGYFCQQNLKRSNWFPSPDPPFPCAMDWNDVELLSCSRRDLSCIIYAGDLRRACVIGCRYLLSAWLLNWDHKFKI